CDLCAGHVEAWQRGPLTAVLAETGRRRGTALVRVKRLRPFLKTRTIAPPPAPAPRRNRTDGPKTNSPHNSASAETEHQHSKPTYGTSTSAVGGDKVAGGSMKGPGGGLRIDVRRLWECPVCHRREKTPGTVVHRLCDCLAKSNPPRQTWMRLVEE